MGQKDGMRLLGAGGESLPVRNLSQSRPGETGGDDAGHGNRDGVQLPDWEQRAGPNNLGVTLLISLTKNLLRDMGSTLVLELAMSSVRREVQCTPEEFEKFKTFIYAFQKRHSIWPPGFF